MMKNISIFSHSSSTSFVLGTALATLVTTLGHAASLPFTENFDDAAANDFTVAGASGVYTPMPDISGSGHAYQASITSANGNINGSSAVMLENMPDSSFSVSTKLTIKSFSAPGSGGVNAGLGLYSNSADFSTGGQYRVLYQLAQGNAGKLQILRNGISLAVSDAVMPPRLNVPYLLKAIVSRSNGVITLHGQLSDDFNTIAVSVTDTAPLPGSYFGYRTAVNAVGGTASLTAAYDDFIIGPTQSGSSSGNQSVAGSLSVGGSIDLTGNEITLGASSGTYAAGFLYDSVFPGELTFDLTNADAAWRWQHGGTTGMLLDAQNRLTLFAAPPETTQLKLHPGGVSEFPSVKISGSLTVQGPLRIAPSGNLSMGEFTAGANPAD